MLLHETVNKYICLGYHAYPRGGGHPIHTHERDKADAMVTEDMPLVRTIFEAIRVQGVLLNEDLGYASIATGGAFSCCWV